MSNDPLVPFDSKVKEINRNVKLISDRIQGIVETVTLLHQFSQDLDLLSQEVDLTDTERSSLVGVKSQIEENLNLMRGYLLKAHETSIGLSELLTGDLGYGPYLGRKVTNPFKPLFSGKISSRLLKLGSEKPEIRPHLRPILDYLKKGNDE